MQFVVWQIYKCLFIPNCTRESCDYLFSFNTLEKIDYYFYWYDYLDRGATKVFAVGKKIRKSSDEIRKSSEDLGLSLEVVWWSSGGFGWTSAIGHLRHTSYDHRQPLGFFVRIWFVICTGVTFCTGVTLELHWS